MDSVTGLFGGLAALGVATKDLVLELAGWLKNAAAPGLVSILLIVSLLVAATWFFMWVRRRSLALRRASAMIRKAADVASFRVEAPQIDARFHAWEGSRNPAERAIAAAWSEYRETNASEDRDGALTIRNALRPNLFFNMEDLNFATGRWRILPGLFVSIGLALTFLGLISALAETSSLLTPGANEAAKQNALRDLLTIASAKFIMSLTGLVASIIFTVVLRRGLGRLDGDLHGLCSAIEQRLSYVSLEQLAMDQLAAIRDQKEHLTKLNAELIADLGRPLREELPAAISRSIAEAMAPVVASVGQAGAAGMGDMVRDLSSRFSSDVGEALGAASARLAEAGERLGGLATRMDQSTERAGATMDASVARLADAVGELRTGMAQTAAQTSEAFSLGADRMLDAMNQTLERIRENTEQSAAALTRAVEAMTGAGSSFRNDVSAAGAEARVAAARELGAAASDAAATVGAAGASVTQAFEALSRSVAAQASEAADAARTELLAPIAALRDALSDIVRRAEGAGAEMARFAEATAHGAASSEQAARGLGESAGAIASAADPIRDALRRMESAVATASEASSGAAEESRLAAERVARVSQESFRAAETLLGAERHAIETGLAAINAALNRLGEMSGRFDQIDAQLGEAFETFESKVRSAITEVGEHADKVYGQYSGALDTLREVVDSARELYPDSERR